MIPNAPPKPLIVSDQSVTAPLWTSLRGVLMWLGGILTSKGYVDADTAQTAVGVAMAVIPWIWGIVLAWWNKRRLIVAASSADDRVAKVI